MNLYYESDSLNHASLKKKYIAKLPVGNGKYRYFYSQAEYAAFTNKIRNSTIRKLGYDTKKDVIPSERRGGMKSYGYTRTSDSRKKLNIDEAVRKLNDDIKRSEITKKKQKRINRKRKLQKSLKKIGINWDW